MTEAEPTTTDQQQPEQSANPRAGPHRRSRRGRFCARKTKPLPPRNAWDEIEKAQRIRREEIAHQGRRDRPHQGRPHRRHHGARAFLPGSQVDLRPVRNLDG
jgi:hypothetical protein